MNKSQLFEKVIKDSEKGGLIRYSYFKDGCYCAVGLALKHLGMTDDELCNLGTVAVDFILDGTVQNPITSIAKEKMESTIGMSIDEWKLLQMVNDESEKDFRVSGVVNFLKQC